MIKDIIWKLDHYKAVAQIISTQWHYWLMRGIYLWIACTLVIWFAGVLWTPERSRLLVSWLWSYQPFLSVVYNGVTYDNEVWRNWCNQHFFHGSPLDWLLWAGQWAALPVSLISSIGMYRLQRSEDHEEHIRGTKLSTVPELNKKLSKIGRTGIRLGPILIPDAELDSHLMFIGMTGAGKSVAMRHFLDQIAKRGERVAIVDPEGEHTQMFFNPARGDVILNPRDDRFIGWHPWAEGLTSEDIDAMGASLFPIPTQIEGSPASYFRSTARLVWRALMERMPDHDLRIVPHLLSNPKELLKLLDGTDAESELGHKDTKERHQILSTMRIATASFRYIDPGSPSWSAREWVKNGKGWAFFTYTETQKAAVMPFFSLLLDSLGRQILELPLDPTQRLWAYFDEVADLPRIATLPGLMKRARKRGISIGLAFQERSGLVARYGEADTNSILNAAGVQFFMALRDIETQRWASDSIGSRDLVRMVESQTIGPQDLSDRISRRPDYVREEATVSASQFGTMPDLHGILRVGAHGVVPIAIPYVPTIKHHPAFLPRPNVPQQQTPRSSKIILDTSPRSL